MTIRLEILKEARRLVDGGACRYLCDALPGAAQNLVPRFGTQGVNEAAKLVQHVQHELGHENATVMSWVCEQMGMGDICYQDLPEPYKSMRSTMNDRGLLPRLAWLDKLIEQENP